MNVELYIANQLCDLPKPDLGIRLRRQFFNPKELSTKDSQKSYSITLPTTPRNNEIFQHKNVEETIGKFTLYPDARLYVNGILIMEGKFRLTEISSEGYKGNLGVPAPLTAKDIFGERKMNDIGSWTLKDFKGEKSLTEYNTIKAGEKPKPCIFPLVLYGLLPDGPDPKISLDTKFGLTDFPPSINCIQMLKTIFDNTGYTLTGTALDDERLQHLYVSYKNPEDHIMPFEAKKAQITGEWTNCILGEGDIDIKTCERQFARNSYSFPDSLADNEKIKGLIACNIFRSDNLKITVSEDPTHQFFTAGGRVTYKVPKDGLYKIDLQANIKLKHDNDWGSNRNLKISNKDGSETITIAERAQGKWRSFRNIACELKLVRQLDNPEYDLSKATMDCIFYKNNLKQDIDTSTAIFPKPGCVNFIDQAQNSDMLCGFSWGRVVYNNEHWDHFTDESYKVPEYHNPLWKYYREKNEDGEKETLCDFTHPMAIKHGYSWHPQINSKRNSAVYSPGYQKVDHKEGEGKRYVVDMRYDAPYGFTFPTRASSSVSWGDKEISNKPFSDWAKVSDNVHLGEGHIQQVVQLFAGEYINLIITQDLANNEEWIAQDINFTLSVEPFTEDIGWLRMDAVTEDNDNNGGSTINKEEKEREIINWSDPVQFMQDQIDLMGFLPKEVKIDDWLSNFCKAFNLELIHTGERNFALNMKEHNIVKNTSLIIDLDSKANVYQTTNESLALPRTYKLGFTIDTAEEGYVESIDEGKDITEGDTGGGIFDTGSNETNQIEQTSNFSYCWYKTLDKELKEEEQGKNKTKPIEVPVIADHEIWAETSNYNEVSNKTYFNKAQRFWFHSGKTEEMKVHNIPAQIAIVQNEYKGNKNLWLNYHDKPNSIMREYFTLLTNDKEYTTVECYLTPQEYDMLDKALIRFNGDLYNVVDADGFDPLKNSKTKLKLIKKI